MIFTERTITISGDTCEINKPIVLYRGDYNIEVRFTIIESPFKYTTKNSTNIIEDVNASYGQLVIKTPNGKPPIFTDVVETNEGSVVFTLSGEMIDESVEVGDYTFQIRLFDSNKESRATIPPIENGISIREPIAIEDVSTTNEVDVATVGYALTTAGVSEDAFDAQGNYNKTTWATGDRITAPKLNKIEAGIEAAFGSGTSYDDTEVKNDINNIKTDLGTAELTTTAKNVKGAINEVNSQIKEKADQAELIDARIGKDGITYNNVGDAIRNQVEDKLDKYNKTLITNYSFVKNGMGSNGGMVSGLNRKRYSIEIGEEYLLIGNLTTDKAVDIMAQATGTSNTDIVSDTRIPKEHDGFQKIKFVAQYKVLFVTCNNQDDFNLYKIKEAPVTTEAILDIISNSPDLNYIKNSNDVLNKLMEKNIDISSKKEADYLTTNLSTISTNGTHINSGNLKIYNTIPGKYYLITGTSEFNKSYGLFAFFSSNTYGRILKDTLVLANPGLNKINHLVQAPTNGNLLRISRGTYGTDDIEVYEFDIKNKTFTKQEIQRYKCFDDSIIKCSPFMYEGIGWKTYNPRLNILMFNDFNDEPGLLQEVGGWFDYDDRFVNQTIPCIISQGDIVWNDNTSNSTWIPRAKNIVDIICNIDKPFIFCNGNHDVGQDNIGSTFDVSTNRDVRYDNFFKPLLDRLNVMTNNAVVIDANNPRSQYYYVDINDKHGHKIRCFALDESEYPLIIDTDGYLKYSMCLIDKSEPIRGNNTYYSEKQMKFLIEAMQSCENDRLFILLNHIDMPTTEKRGSLSGSRECLHAIIKGFRTNTDVNFTVDALEDIPSYTINATFSNKTGVHPTIHFVGHYHRFESDIIVEAGNMHRVQTMSAGTMVTGVSSSNSILRFGSDIFSMDKNFDSYFLRFGYKYQANKIGDDGTHFINEPINLL